MSGRDFVSGGHREGVLKSPVLCPHLTNRAADKALESLGILAALRTASSDETSAGETLLVFQLWPIQAKGLTRLTPLCPQLQTS